MFVAGAIGQALPDYVAPSAPAHQGMSGHWVTLEPLTQGHSAALFAAWADQPDLWTYMGHGPFATEDALRDWIASVETSQDPQFYAIVPKGGAAVGVASYLRITPKDGVIEVGNICYGPSLQGTPAATEAMVLMMARAFDMGYRRYEWKCNAHNLSSRRAAQRLGFSFEGVFRQHMIIKGANRDTAWFSIIDSEWQALRSAYATWLDRDNFDASGRQKTALSALTGPLLAARDPAL